MPRKGLKLGTDYEVISGPVQYKAIDGSIHDSKPAVQLANGRWKLTKLAGMSTPAEAKAELTDIGNELGMQDGGVMWIDVGNLADDERLPRVFASLGGVVDSLIKNEAFVSALIEYSALVKRIDKKTTTAATGTNAATTEGGEAT